MDCDSVKKSLMESIVSAGDKEIVEHISNCGECSSFASDIEAVNTLVGKLKNSKPTLDEAEQLTLRIMNQIENEIKYNKAERSSFTEKFFDWLFVPQLRVILYSILFLLTGLYFLEEATALNDVIELENHLNDAGSRYEASFTEDIPNLSFLYDAYKMLIGERKHVNLSKEWMIVNKKFIKEVFLEYDNLSPEKKGIIDKLRQNITAEQKEFIDELLESELTN